MQAALDGYGARLKWQHQNRMTAAWHGAAITRSKKMPELNKMLGECQPMKAQTHDQMLALMQSLVKQD